MNAWLLIYDRALTRVRGPQWFHRDSNDVIGIIVAHPVHRSAGYGSPLNVGPAVVTQLFVMWKSVSDRRVEINQWSTNSNHPESRESYEAVRRNIDCLRAPVALEQAALRAGKDEDIRDTKGNIAYGQADDEPVPQISDETLATPSPFPALGPTWNAEKAENAGETCPNPEPRPASQRVKIGESTESEMEDQEFIARRP